MCTSVMAGKAATDDNTILLARNEDYAKNNWNKYLTFRPYPEYHDPHNDNPVVSDAIWTLGNGLKVPVPQQNFSYSAIPDFAAFQEASNNINNRFFYEERGINEVNVAISATNSMEAINDRVKDIDPFVLPGIEEAIIPTLLLPQAKTAKEAVLILGNYVETYGSAEGNGILFGDPSESWYMEIGSGHHWIAVRIPDEKYLIVANGLRIHDVDLSSRDTLHSADLFNFVEKHQLLLNPDVEHFNFAAAFGTPGIAYNTDRIWLAQKILTPSFDQAPRKEQYPLFLKPDKMIGVKAVMQVLRANYKGTVLEGRASRPIGVDRTAESHIIILDDKMPFELQGVIWQCISTPLGAPYMPLFACLRDIPTSYMKGGNQYDPGSAYWSFRALHGLSQEGKYHQIIDVDWNIKEDQFVNDQYHLKNMLKELYVENKEQSVNYAANYSTGILYQTVGEANKLMVALMTSISAISPEEAPAEIPEEIMTY